MADIQLLTVISERGRGDRIMKVLRRCGAEMIVNSAGVGTATEGMLHLLGLNRTEKDFVFALCEGSKAKDIMTEVVMEARALIFSTSLSRISVPLFQIEPQAVTQKREGVSSMNENIKHEVIIVMANRGCIDEVMDAARSAGATGGTVIHARGTGSSGANHFYGVTLADERDVFFIVTPVENRDAIMQAIVSKAGLKTASKAAVFSVPIQNMVGFPHPENKNDQGKAE